MCIGWSCAPKEFNILKIFNMLDLYENQVVGGEYVEKECIEVDSCS